MTIRKSMWASAIAVCAAAGLSAACAGSPVAPDAGIAMMSAGGGALQSRAPSKIDICHVDGKGDYRKISVAAPAEPAHLAHGDAHPFDPAPGSGGSGSSAGGFFHFDENCQIVAGPPPCSGSSASSSSSGGC